MAQNGLPFGAPQDTPHQDPYSTPLTNTAMDDDIEDPNDWEYEYSSAETEVSFLHLDY